MSQTLPDGAEMLSDDDSHKYMGPISNKQISDNKYPAAIEESDMSVARRILTSLLAIDFFTYDVKINIDDYMIATKFKKDLLFEIAKNMTNTDAWLYCMIVYFGDYVSISDIAQNHFRKNEIQTPRSIHFASLRDGLVKFNANNFIDANTTSKLMAKYQNIVPSTVEIKDTNVIKETISRNPYCTSKFVGKISIDHIVDAIMLSKARMVICNNRVDEIIADTDLIAYDEHTNKRIINAYVEKIIFDGRAIHDYPLHIFVDNPDIDETLKVEALNRHGASVLEVLAKDEFYDLYADYLHNFRKYKTCESMLKWPFFPGFSISGQHIEVMLKRKDPRVINTLVYMYNIIDDGRPKGNIKYAFTHILGVDIDGMFCRERKIVCDVTNFKRMHNIYKLDPDVCLTAIAHNVENIKYAKCRLASFCREVHRLYPYHVRNLRYITEDVAIKIASQNIELPQIYKYRTKILAKQISLIPQCKLTENECNKFIFVCEKLKKDKRKFDKLMQNPHIRRFLRSNAAARFRETRNSAISNDILQQDEVMRSGKMTKKWILANINYLFFDDW